MGCHCLLHPGFETALTPLNPGASTNQTCRWTDTLELMHGEGTQGQRSLQLQIGGFKVGGLYLPPSPRSPTGTWLLASLPPKMGYQLAQQAGGQHSRRELALQGDG